MRDFLRSRRFKVLLAVLAVLLGFMIYAGRKRRYGDHTF